MNISEEKGERCPFYEASLFTESGVAFLATYRFWIVAAVWVAARVYPLWGLVPDPVVEGYYHLAGDWLDGFVPYRDFKLEYPPGALALLALPRIFFETPAGYGYGLAALMLLADLATLSLLVRIASQTFDRDDDRDTGRRYRSALLCLIYVLFTAFWGHLLLQRYALVTALLLTAAIHAALRKKALTVDALLAVAIWLNPGAIVWIPLLWLYDIGGRFESLPSEWNRKLRDLTRVLLPRIALLAGGLCVLFLPFFLTAGRSLAYFVQFCFAQGPQLDSTPAAVVMLGAKIFGFELSAAALRGAVYLKGAAGAAATAVSWIVAVLVLGVLTLAAARMMPARSDARERGVWLVRGLPAAILALLATGGIFRPHYLLWVAPLAALLAHCDRPRLRDAGGFFFAVSLLTIILFYFYYPELARFDILPVILLLLRNALMIWTAMLLLRPESPAAVRRHPITPAASQERNYLIYLSMVLLFAWGTVAAFCPASSNDLWLLLREAIDIIASGKVPQVEQYSAVAFGRPYLAHEWLSGLVFLGIFKLGGGEALTVFRASAMLAMLLLLWYSLEKEDRRFMLAAPLLALAAYTILIRVFVRPHIFTHLFLCLWVFCLEHWRRERRLRYLIVLVPLQVLWANLHGGYIFAPVLGAVVTGTTALLVLRPGWSKDERYAWSDVGTAAALTAACLAVSLINPNGAQLLKFSLNIGLASDYIKQVVFEWASPLGPRYADSYGREAAIGLFLIMWLGLALNVKRRPLLDAALALLATVMSVQAVRFLSFIGMLGFPLAVRAWRAVADAQINSPYTRRRPVLETALFGLLLASTTIYGFPYGETKHRSVGWGLGGRMPYQETEYLAAQELKGAIFNDYGDGAFLIYHLYPRIRPVMDSRIDVYGRELYQEYLFSRQNPIKFFRYLNKYKVSLILLRKSQENLQINQYLNYIPATKLLLETERRYLFSYDPDLLPPDIQQQLSQ
jgi:hypothetical protein